MLVDHAPGAAFIRGAALLLSPLFFPCTPARADLFPQPTTELGALALRSASADLNGDGRRDLAVITKASASSAYTIKILLSADEADGFEEVDLSVSSVPLHIVTGDFNADGRQDLAVSRSQGFVSIFRGRGDGTFEPQEDVFQAEVAQCQLLSASFDRDAAADLALRCTDLWVALSRGDGSFATPVRTDVRSGSLPFLAGDFNGDGLADVALTDLNAASVFEMSVLFGRGDGGFLVSQILPLPRRPVSMLVEDFNLDGSVDLALRDDRSITVFLGAGNGILARVSEIPAQGNNPSMASADLNHDGRPDLAFAGFGLLQSAEIHFLLLGKGDGTFEVGRAIWEGRGSGLQHQQAADFTGDGAPDVAIVEPEPGEAYLLRGRGDGTFLAPARFATGPTSGAIAAADFDTDGRADVVTLNRGSRDLSLLRGRGDGTFDPQFRIAATAVGGLLLAEDLNSDGRPDLAVSDSDSPGLSILLSAGDGTFVAAPILRLASSAAGAAVGDFNSDGRKDLFVHTFNQGFLYLGNGDGTFLMSAGPVRAFTSSGGPAVGDLNNDGADDVVVAFECLAQGCDQGKDAPVVMIYLSDGLGGLRQPQVATIALDPPVSFKLGDFNADGSRDLVVADGVDLRVLLGAGDGTFTVRERWEGQASLAKVADLDSDGRLDLILNSGGIQRGNGDGSFRAPERYVGIWGAVDVADFDGDGRLDVTRAWTSLSSCSVPLAECLEGAVSVFLNSGPFPMRDVGLDVKPGETSSVINLRGRGTLPAAVLGAADFHTASIDRSSLRLAGAPPRVSTSTGEPACGQEDVNSDGWADLLCHYRTIELDPPAGATSLVLEGRTLDGQRIRGEDSVSVLRHRPLPTANP